jgi:hypothetical protein
MNQKIKQQRFLKYLWLLNILQKLRYGHFLGPGSATLIYTSVAEPPHF